MFVKKGGNRLDIIIDNKKFLGLIILTILLITCFFLSILLGYEQTNFKDLIDAYLNFNSSIKHTIIISSRIPRALTALFVGTSLAISGVLMQELTKNKLASPSIFGINSGASFFVVLIISLFPKASSNQIALSAITGSFLSVLFVYILAGGLKGDVRAINITLSGAAISSLFFSLTQSVLYKDQKTLEEILFWMTGSVDNTNIQLLTKIAPYLVAAWALSFLISKKLNIFSLGEDTAKSLGQNTNTLKIYVSLLIVVLSGGSVAVAGPISLVCLLSSHLAKKFIGSDYRWVIPYSALLGGIFLLLSDVISRFIIYPKEVPVGVMTALIGAPFFIYIAKKGELQNE